MNTYPVCAIIPPLGQASSTWANFPAASSVPVGTLRTATDYNYTEWHSDGTYWKPRGGRQRIINALPAFSSTGTASEVAAYTPTLPANMLFPGCQIDLGGWADKTGTAGGMTVRVRYNGAAGQNMAFGGSPGSTTITNIFESMVLASAASGGAITLTQPFPTQTSQQIAGSSTTAPITQSHTMANAATMNFTLQGNASDTLRLNNVWMEICG